jgi:hypothetical protein
MVEFALVAPVFFVLLLGIVEAGRFVFYYETLNNATREGARLAIVNGANSLDCPVGPPALGTFPCDVTGEAVKARVRSYAFGIPPASITVPTPVYLKPDGSPGGDNGRGSIVQVEATYAYTTIVPLLPLPPITVHAESSLVVNN